MANKAKTKGNKANQKEGSLTWGSILTGAYFYLTIVLDMVPSSVIWLALVVYRFVVRRWPLFLQEIDTLKRSNASKETEIQQLKSLIERKESRLDKEKEIRQLKKLIESKNKESRLSKDREIQQLNKLIESKDEIRLKSKMIKSLEDEVNRVNYNLKTKVTENAELEAEKKEALRRLSEQVSIKLRDNNPNIVDLNDQCRPTKLAEMFSELYDNEWTSAYFVLEETFSEKCAISILLHAVMSAYEVSKGRVEESWQILGDWFLDESLPGAKQTTKWLKDSRKINVKRKVSGIGTDFKEKDFKVYLSSMCEDYKVKQFLSDGAIDTYLMKCIELCLLMVSTDPPVVLVCPGWETTRTLHRHDKNMEGSYLNEGTGGRNCVAENGTTDDRIGGTTQKNTERRELFDKELFKEYTSRGKYIDYIVWPAMLLHRDGPLLRKGIAQGT